jgi:endonuclease YncB( thermonuclease family)
VTAQWLAAWWFMSGWLIAGGLLASVPAVAVAQAPATSAWATGGASASAKPTDTDGKPAAAVANSSASVPFWQATAVPGHVIQQPGGIPPGWQPQAVPYQGVGPDGRPLTMYIAPTYVFTYQSGPPVIATPPVNRRQAPWTRTAPAVQPAPGWNYQTSGATPVPVAMPPATVAQYRPQPYQFPVGARALDGTPIVAPQATALPPPPQNWGVAPPPLAPPPNQWVPAPVAPPPDQWMPSNVPPPPGVAPVAVGAAAVAAPALVASAAPPPPPASFSPPMAPIPVATPQPIAAQPVSSAPMQPMAAPAPAAGLPANATPANTHAWKVVAVYDGDTVTCIDENNQQQKIRLAEIDAPEAKQDFGQASRQSLANMVFGRTIQVVDSGRDRYGRWIGRLYVDGIDVNRQQVATGMAWHYADYSKDKSLATVQAQAQAQRIGLWSQPNPIPPWEFRKSGKK